MTTKNADEWVVTFPEVVWFVRRGLAAALFVGLLAAAAAFLVSEYLLPPTYRASAVLLMGEPLATVDAWATAPLSASAYRAAGESDVVLRDALASLGTADPTPATIDRMRERLRIAPRIEEGVAPDLLEVTVHGRDAALASASANAIADALRVWDSQRATDALNDAVASLEIQLASLDAQAADGDSGDALADVRADLAEDLTRARARAAAPGSDLTLLRPATEPLRPAFPRPFLNALLAFVVGIAAAYAVLLANEAMK